jgi:hypothetical protein
VSTICYPCATHTSEVRMKFSPSGGLLPYFLKRLYIFFVYLCIYLCEVIQALSLSCCLIYDSSGGGVTKKTTRDVRTD